MNNSTTVILPQAEKTLVLDTAPYWASFYCGILKTVRYQKNLTSSWNNSKSLQDYRGALRESGFFKNMEKTVLNHAFEYVMVDFLRTKTGIECFKSLCTSILADYEINGFNITKMNIFKVGNDSELYFAKQNYNLDRVLMLLPENKKAYPETKTRGLTLNETLDNSDLFILISNDEETIGFVGEVEGNNGEDLFLASYFKRKPVKDKYCTFCIGISEKTKHNKVPIKGEISLNKSEAVGRWILNFSKSSYFAKDYRSAVRNIQGLVDGHFGHLEDIEDLGHTKILNAIKIDWARDIDQLISTLESFIDYVFPTDTFYYQEIIDGKTTYRPSPLALPGELPLYSIEPGSVIDSQQSSTIYIPK
ncbi:MULTISPECIES: hypothetical protein [Enterobacterales]|uniref:hypothetical protein n=1 Tax=Enterobacterales TaxID=91347 RepID=UPI0010BE8B14|nr:MULTISPECIES: hypothetical protein [Enterobacterales]QCJ68844.1 hypothetical protein C9446_02510 [Providencia heimbachae]GKV81042.1 hypothetical protein PEC106664_18160 [Pectobacterium carotovorum subsp. carotovorum]